MAPRRKKTDTGSEPPKAAELPAVPFEKALEALEAIVRRLDGEELGIEAAMAEYEKGLEALRACRSILDAAERKLEVLVREEGGKAVTKPFTPEGVSPAPHAPEPPKAPAGKADGDVVKKEPGEEEEAEEEGPPWDEGDDSAPPDATSRKNGFLF
jgi:exodeoxyribonuclease VII small subunit